ncbi:MAG: 1-acyl-sn-glycerol-3-phosphate acyltransferase [Pseudomonadota bacterium]|nr:1-acyl-sn-glycerol-3-phosphate acyltransferase [Pseudomonadota bacterium]
MDFSDIASYDDDQVAIKLNELESNEDFHNYISSLIFPRSHKYFSKINRIYLRRKFKQIFSDCNSIDQFQDCLAPLVTKMIDKTTDGFTYSGVENLTEKPTLFVGNHRDISLDPAFLNYLLYTQGLSTVRIAIGDNLLDDGYAEMLMRLNKSFIVHRNIKGVKETLRKLSKLSAYINHSLMQDKESIWIAQREGRANDGNDFTDEGVLKMLYLDQRKALSIYEWVRSVNLTPIVISYEYDPLDYVKARGWDHQDSLTLEEINKSDIKEMSTGIFGYKGRVHLHICKPISDPVDTTRHLAEMIQREIINNYRIWPTNQAALDLLPEINIQQENIDTISDMPSKISILEKRCANLKPEERNEFLMTYARPIVNKEKARLSSGP